MRTYIALLSLVVLLVGVAAVAQPPRGAELMSPAEAQRLVAPHVDAIQDGLGELKKLDEDAYWRLVAGMKEYLARRQQEPETQRVPVQIVAPKRELSASEERHVAHVQKWARADGQPEAYVQDLGTWAAFLLGIRAECETKGGVIHPGTDLGKKSKEGRRVYYDKLALAYQLITEVLEHFTFYVNVPMPRELPPFIPADTVPQVPPIQLKKVHLPCTNIFTAFETNGLGQLQVGMPEKVGKSDIPLPCTNIFSSFTAQDLGQLQVSVPEKVQLLELTLDLNRVGEFQPQQTSYVAQQRVEKSTERPANLPYWTFRESHVGVLGARLRQQAPCVTQPQSSPNCPGVDPPTEPTPGEAGNTNPVTTIPVVDSPVVAPNPGVDPTAPVLPVPTTPGQPGDIYNPPSEPTPGQPGAHPAGFSF